MWKWTSKFSFSRVLITKLKWERRNESGSNAMERCKRERERERVWRLIAIRIANKYYRSASFHIPPAIPSPSLAPYCYRCWPIPIISLNGKRGNERWIHPVSHPYLYFIIKCTIYNRNAFDNGKWMTHHDVVRLNELNERTTSNTYIVQYTTSIHLVPFCKKRIVLVHVPH